MAFGTTVKMMFGSEVNSEPDANGLLGDGIGSILTERNGRFIHEPTGTRLAYYEYDEMQEVPVYLVTFISTGAVISFVEAVTERYGPIIMGGSEQIDIVSSRYSFRIDGVTDTSTPPDDDRWFHVTGGRLLDQDRFLAALPALLSSNLQDEIAEYDDEDYFQETFTLPDDFPAEDETIAEQFPAYGYDISVGSLTMPPDMVLSVIMSAFGVSTVKKTVLADGNWTADFEARNLSVSVSYPSLGFDPSPIDAYETILGVSISGEDFREELVPQGLEIWARRFGMVAIEQIGYSDLEGEIVGAELHKDGTLAHFRHQITEDDYPD